MANCINNREFLREFISLYRQLLEVRKVKKRNLKNSAYEKLIEKLEVEPNADRKMVWKKINVLNPQRSGIMEASNVVNLKVFLRDEKDSEVRRFSVDSSVVTSYIFMREKLQTVFPSLRDADFKITWQDGDGDHITIATDEDFITAFTELNGSVKVLYVTVSNRNIPAAMFEVDGPGLMHYPRVICDVCNQTINGFRYKCVQCPDYDLCPGCEYQGNHSEHIMMRVPHNDIYMPKCARKFMHHLSRGFKKSTHTANKEAYRAAKYASKFCGNAAAAAAAAAATSAFGPSQNNTETNQNAQSQTQERQNPADSQDECPFMAGDENPIRQFLNLTGMTQENLKPVFDFIKEMAAPQPTEPNQSATNNFNNDSNSAANPNADFLADSIRNVMDNFMTNFPKSASEKAADTQTPASGASGISTPKNDKETSANMDVDENTNAASKAPEAQTNKISPGWTFVATNNGKSTTPQETAASATQQEPSAPTFVYHENPKIAEGLVKLHEMGFSNDSGLLTRMLERYHGDVESVIRAIVDLKF